MVGNSNCLLVLPPNIIDRMNPFTTTCSMIHQNQNKQKGHNFNPIVDILIMRYGHVSTMSVRYSQHSICTNLYYSHRCMCVYKLVTLCDILMYFISTLYI